MPGGGRGAEGAGRAPRASAGAQGGPVARDGGALEGARLEGAGGSRVPCRGARGGRPLGTGPIARQPAARVTARGALRGIRRGLEVELHP